VLVSGQVGIAEIELHLQHKAQEASHCRTFRQAQHGLRSVLRHLQSPCACAWAQAHSLMHKCMASCP
jgi:hypothetical protein